MLECITNAAAMRWQRLFPERQIYLRSNGQVKYVALPPVAQFAATMAMFIVVAWVGIASANLIFKDEILAARDQQLKEVQSAYAGMSAEIAQIQQRFLTATLELEAKHRLLANLAGHRQPTGRLPENSSLPALAPDSAKLAFSNQFEGNVRALEARLSSIHESQRDLVAGFENEADKTIDALEALIEKTGLDANKLVSRASKGASAAGGPLIPLPGSNAMDAPEFKKLSSRLGRLEMLRKTLFGLPLADPLDSFYVSSNYGYRRDPFTRAKAFHSGLDMVAPHGSPIRASAPGKVIFAGRNGPYGNMIELDHGNGIHSRYGHMSKITVRLGEQVGLRGLIGLVGNTGRSGTSHLHYEVWVDGQPSNPQNFMRAGENVFQRQG